MLVLACVCGVCVFEREAKVCLCSRVSVGCACLKGNLQVCSRVCGVCVFERECAGLLVPTCVWSVCV